MCILLFVLKNERQQCQYKHTKNHKILEGVIYHRHHLHPTEFRQRHPATRLSLLLYHINKFWTRKKRISNSFIKYL